MSQREELITRREFDDRTMAIQGQIANLVTAEALNSASIASNSADIAKLTSTVERTRDMVEKLSTTMASTIGYNKGVVIAVTIVVAIISALLTRTFL